jgi:Lanthionine-containing peptide SapB precursor RamS
MALLDLQTMKPPAEERETAARCSHGSHGCNSCISLILC